MALKMQGQFGSTPIFCILATNGVAARSVSGENLTMATTAIAIAGQAFGQLASIDEASATARLASSSLEHHIKLLMLGRRLRKMNSGIQGLFDKIDSHSDSSAAGPEVRTEQYTRDRILSLAEQVFAVYFLYTEIYRRCASARLTNCSKFGVAFQLSELRSLSERLWGLGDWLQMYANPEIYDGPMAAGDAEIERGDFESFS